MKTPKSKTTRQNAGTAPAFRFDDEIIEIFAGLLQHSTDRAMRALDEANNDIRLSMDRIAMLEKAHELARRLRRSGKSQSARPRRPMLSRKTRELVDYLVRDGGPQLKTTTQQIDRANRQLDEILVSIRRDRTKKPAALTKVREKARSKKPKTASSRLQRLARGRR